MRESLKFLIAGDSEAGKSSFIRNFCEPNSAKMLNISGQGQTTRCNGVYNFNCTSSVTDSAYINFYSKQEFIDKHLEKIFKTYDLYLDKAENKLNDSIIESKSEKDISFKEYSWKDTKRESLLSICDKDLISDEFINLSELGFSEQDRLLLSITEINEIENFQKFDKILKGKIGLVYDRIKEIIHQFLEQFNLRIDYEKELNTKEDIINLRFNLEEETTLLLTYCTKKATIIEQRQSRIKNVTTLAGVVKNTIINLQLNRNYEQICSKLGISKITLIDTYGLDHAPNQEGNIDIKDIKKRLTYILNEEYRDIDTVIFITPMTGKATATNYRFKALIESKRSIIPQIIYTKYDIYAKSQLGISLAEMEASDLEEVVNNFNRDNSNTIKDDFMCILREYYSEDVSEYRKQCIFSNVSYFMGKYEMENKQEQEAAEQNNLKYFKSILLSIFKNDNYGISSKYIDKIEVTEQLEKVLLGNQHSIEEKINIMLEQAQKKLVKNYNQAHYNTTTAFWRRIRSNMVGFSGDLNIRNILIDTYREFIATDSGIHKDNNLGNILVSDYFRNNDLNIFLRECINKFGDYYFCTGCAPCDSLKPEVSDMSTACNNTGRYERANRGIKCRQYIQGIHAGSQSQAVYCVNNGINGIGILDTNYGNCKNCLENCFWNFMFSMYKETNEINLFVKQTTKNFIVLFRKFFINKYEESIKSTYDFEYLNKYNLNPVMNDTEERDDEHIREEIINSCKKYIILTEGKTDKIHLEVAWNKLEDSEMPFDIFSIDGADKLKLFLISYPQTMFEDKIFISILDYDNKGIKIYNELKNMVQFNNDQYTKKYYCEKDDKDYYVIILPHGDKQLEKYENGEIELLYNRNILEKYDVLSKRSLSSINNLKYVKDNSKYIRAEEYESLTELHYYEIDGKKIDFANKVKMDTSLIKQDFKAFNELFKRLKNIING